MRCVHEFKRQRENCEHLVLHPTQYNDTTNLDYVLLLEFTVAMVEIYAF